MEHKDLHYDAFISYRHGDVDEFVAAQLHKLLEGFRIPKSIAKSLNHAPKFSRIFRDHEELPLSSDLSESISCALENSDFLIVICSPRTKESRWVRQEIKSFIAMHGHDHVLSVLVSGEPQDAFPEEITHVEESFTDAAGNLCTRIIEVEPLAADVRGKDEAQIKKKLKSEMLRLAAPMLSCSYDGLKQRHREQKARRVMFLTSLLTLVLALFGTFSLYQWRQIQINYDQSQVNLEASILNLNQSKANQSRYLAQASLDAYNEGDLNRALRLAEYALPSEGNERPYDPFAEFALTKALCTYENGANYLNTYTLEAQGEINDMGLVGASYETASRGYILCTDNLGYIYVFDGETNEQIFSLQADRGIDLTNVSVAGDMISILYSANAESGSLMLETYSLLTSELVYEINAYDADDFAVISCNVSNTSLYGNDDYVVTVFQEAICIYERSTGILLDQWEYCNLNEEIVYEISADIINDEWLLVYSYDIELVQLYHIPDQTIRCFTSKDIIREVQETEDGVFVFGITRDLNEMCFAASLDWQSMIAAAPADNNNGILGDIPQDLSVPSEEELSDTDQDTIPDETENTENTDIQDDGDDGASMLLEEYSIWYKNYGAKGYVCQYVVDEDAFEDDEDDRCVVIAGRYNIVVCDYLTGEPENQISTSSKVVMMSAHATGAVYSLESGALMSVQFLYLNNREQELNYGYTPVSLVVYGDDLAYSVAEHGTCVNVQTRRVSDNATSIADNGTYASFADDDRLLVIGEGEKITSYDVESGNIVGEFDSSGLGEQQLGYFYNDKFYDVYLTDESELVIASVDVTTMELADTLHIADDMISLNYVDVYGNYLVGVSTAKVFSVNLETMELSTFDFGYDAVCRGICAAGDYFTALFYDSTSVNSSTITLFDSETCESVETINDVAAIDISSISFCNAYDGSWMAYVNETNELVIYDCSSHDESVIPLNTSRVSSICESIDQTSILVNTENNLLQMIRVSDGVVTRQLDVFSNILNNSTWKYRDETNRYYIETERTELNSVTSMFILDENYIPVAEIQSAVAVNSDGSMVYVVNRYGEGYIMPILSIDELMESAADELGDMAIRNDEELQSYLPIHV